MEIEKVEVGEVFTIDDENGEEQEVEVLAAVNIEGIEYVAVSFVEDLIDGLEDIDVFFLKVDEDGDFAALESDGEFNMVSAAFDDLLEDDDDDE